MKRTRKWLINFVSISLLFVSLNSIAAVDYPANPVIDDTAIYLSDAGISKINIERLFLIQAYPKQGTVMISNNQGKIDGLVKWQKRVSNDLAGAPVLLKEGCSRVYSQNI